MQSRFYALAREYTVNEVLNAAKAASGPDAPSIQPFVVAQLHYLGTHYATGLTKAHEAVALLRSARDYNPDRHGRTDDEIADKLLLALEERRRKSP